MTFSCISRRTQVKPAVGDVTNAGSRVSRVSSQSDWHHHHHTSVLLEAAPIHSGYVFVRRFCVRRYLSIRYLWHTPISCNYADDDTRVARAASFPPRAHLRAQTSCAHARDKTQCRHSVGSNCAGWWVFRSPLHAFPFISLSETSPIRLWPPPPLRLLLYHFSFLSQRTGSSAPELWRNGKALYNLGKFNFVRVCMRMDVVTKWVWANGGWGGGVEVKRDPLGSFSITASLQNSGVFRSVLMKCREYSIWK